MQNPNRVITRFTRANTRFTRAISIRANHFKHSGKYSDQRVRRYQNNLAAAAASDRECKDYLKAA